MSRNQRWTLVSLAALILLSSACAVRQQMSSNALEFLYPKNSEARPAQDVELQLPLRVGVGFAPSGLGQQTRFSESQKQALLERIAEAFRGREGIDSVEAIPSGFLKPRGGFDNVDQLVPALGIDLVALVSYDQFQFSESGRSSWSYWTIVGAYVVKGEKNETRTILNTVVYDIPSRAMLFNASGESSVQGKSLPLQIDKALREGSERGFEMSTDDLIAKLDIALQQFQTQVASGTVRGRGTPAITMVDEAGRPVTSGGGAGALPPLDALGAVALVSIAWLTRRNRDYRS